MAIADQRTMYGTRLEEPEAVAGFWESWARSRGFVLDPDKRAPSAGKETLKAYVSEGRWVAACPNCNGGIACWPEHDQGCCLDCGTLYKIKFPSKAERGKAEALLEERPLELRNWRPDEGEKPAALKTENEAFGY